MLSIAARRRLASFFKLSVPIAGLVLAFTGGAPVVAGPLAGIDPSNLTATALTPDSTITGSKSENLALTDPSLLGQTSSNLINVMIKYDYDATASYVGGVAGFAPTSPKATGKSLKQNAQAVQAYESYIKSKERATSASIKQAVPAASIGAGYTTVYGGVSARVPANQVAALLSVPGVAAVQQDSLEHTLGKDDATDFTGAAAVWPSLGGEAHAGQGVLIGLLDTGIWPENPFFGDNAGLPAPAASHACQFGDGSDVAHLGAAFTCNNKLVGAYAFTNTYMNIIGSDGHEFCNNTSKKCSTRDPAGHGTHTAASAGNSGPSAGTTDHGGPWVITVGASTSDRFFTSTLQLAASNGDTFSMPGVTVTNGVTSATPVVLAQTLPGENVLCQSVLAPGAATGKIVACQRGVNARVDKGYNVSLGGAAGMILYNAINQDVETDNHWLPAIHVNGPSTALLAFINGHSGVTATFAQGTPSATQGDVMAAFSSRGPSAFFLKPDITAPGIQVLAGMAPEPDPTVTANGPAGNLFQAIAGTSMSAPHVAGSAGAVEGGHPPGAPAPIQSALMTSAAQDVVKEDGVTPATPFDAGAGGLRVHRGVNPTLVFNETFANYVASGADPLGRVNLNLPSIDATTMSGELTTTRTAINVSGADQKLGVSIQQPASGTIAVNGKNQDIKVASGGSVTFSITISAPFAAHGQYFGRITLTPRSGNAHTIPVPFNKHQRAGTLSQSCAPTTITMTTSSHCSATVANFAATATNVNLSASARSLRYRNVTGADSVSNHGVSWSGSLSPAIPPQVTSIAPSVDTPAGGYLPLSLFGIAPISGVGDHTVTNFNVPTFSYGSESYSRLGVASNGYLIVGGSSANADVTPFPQHFPNAARPNNVIAPFWTDLNPGAGGAIRIGVLSDGVHSWIVVDWNSVKNFSNATTQNFDVWLQTGSTPPSEQISIEYATIGAGDPGTGVNWGAENRDGTSGQNIASPGPDSNTSWMVHLSGPTAGGQHTIQYDLTSDETGTFTSLAAMTSNLTSGVTQRPVNITVN